MHKWLEFGTEQSNTRWLQTENRRNGKKDMKKQRNREHLRKKAGSGMRKWLESGAEHSVGWGGADKKCHYWRGNNTPPHKITPTTLPSPITHNISSIFGNLQPIQVAPSAGQVYNQVVPSRDKNGRFTFLNILVGAFKKSAHLLIIFSAVLEFNFTTKFKLCVCSGKPASSCERAAWKRPMSRCSLFPNLKEAKMSFFSLFYCFHCLLSKSRFIGETLLFWKVGQFETWRGFLAIMTFFKTQQKAYMGKRWRPTHP